MKPLCFVLMPFGKKKDEEGKIIDFDKIYNDFIKPSIENSDLDPIRADEEQTGGIIHKAMYERLMLCEYAVADLSLLNANVFYELGIRHAIRPYSTITLFESSSRLPFDVNFLRSLPYDRKLDNLEELKSQLTKKLSNAKSHNKDTDSPLFQLVEGIKPSNIEHIKTDIFRKQVEYNKEIKLKLEILRKEKNLEGLISLENEINLKTVEFGVLVDLFLSYRAVEAFKNMISLVKKMPKPLQHSIMIQEQLGFALNRINKRDDAINVLKEIIKNHGNSSETLGILGRVYKDKYKEALECKDNFMAQGYLKKAIDTYLEGFESDFRDVYPGINAITLMDISGDERKDKLLPIVEYALKQKMKQSCDYWDYATLLELSIISENEEEANKVLFNVIDNIREPFEPKTTANNIRMLLEKKQQRKSKDFSWISEIIEKLQNNI
ncbi:TRAFs-binding domain-containing protein [Aliarcobacter cryaerophilus]|uniref:TRAFs-binding domain-containing protein n=1 Tax=Aliarcobacter cryaerophilus TaxID=28198 RepID=UPI001CA351DE|nr:TRAFs-binding domain-containing protein [Aliarcobacter cryaerophilus]